MSVLMISMIETDLTRSAPIGPARDSKRIFGVPACAVPRNSQACFGEIGELARLVAHEVLGRRAREQQRRKALRQVAAQAFQDGAGLLDQPARGALFIAAELRLDVHGSSPRPSEIRCRLFPIRTAASRGKPADFIARGRTR